MLKLTTLISSGTHYVVVPVRNEYRDLNGTRPHFSPFFACFSVTTTTALRAEKIPSSSFGTLESSLPTICGSRYVGHHQSVKSERKREEKIKTKGKKVGVLVGRRGGRRASSAYFITTGSVN